MKRSSWYALISLGTVFVGYTVLMFLFAKLSTTFFCSYVMTACVFLIAAGVLNYFFSGKHSVRNQLYIGALLRYTIAYVVVQLLTSVVIVMLQNYINIVVVLATYVSLLVVFVCVGIMAKAGEEFICLHDPINVRLTSIIKKCQTRIDAMRLECHDSALYDTLNELLEDFRFSDPTTSEVIATQDEELEKLVQCLEILCRTDVTAALTHVKLVKNKLYIRNQMYKQKKG